MTPRYEYNPSQQECMTIFAASCVESVARECGMAPDVMYERMARIHLIDEYILPCYEVLHSESRKNVTADIVKTMELWEERLKELSKHRPNNQFCIISQRLIDDCIKFKEVQLC